MSADDVHIRPAARPVLAEPAGLVEHVQAGVGVVQDGRFLYVNRRLSEMLDYSARDMVGHLQAADIVHPADLALVEERIRRRHRDGVNEPYDIRILRRNGDVVDARVSGHNIQYAGAKADLVTLTDISEIKTALRAADWQARMLEQTEALCRSGSAEIDWAGRGVRLSTGLCRLLGLPESTRSLSPRAVLRRLLPGDCRSVIQSWRDAHGVLEEDLGCLDHLGHGQCRLQRTRALLDDLRHREPAQVRHQHRELAFPQAGDLAVAAADSKPRLCFIWRTCAISTASTTISPPPICACWIAMRSRRRNSPRLGRPVSTS